MRFAPFLHEASGQWMLGIVENHQARPLTRDEVEGLTTTLNDLEQTLIAVIEDLSPKQCE